MRVGPLVVTKGQEDKKCEVTVAVNIHLQPAACVPVIHSAVSYTLAFYHGVFFLFFVFSLPLANHCFVI